VRRSKCSDDTDSALQAAAGWDFSRKNHIEAKKNVEIFGKKVRWDPNGRQAVSMYGKSSADAHFLSVTLTREKAYCRTGGLPAGKCPPTIISVFGPAFSMLFGWNAG
jgi:hypothetical protein